MSSDFVWRMEDVLDQYALPADPRRPLVCFDERPCVLHAEVREPLPMAPGRPQRVEYEYERRGTCNELGHYDPHRGWRRMWVTERRTKAEFTAVMQALADEIYPEADVIRVVLDNLNTHTPASFYALLAPAEAWRLTQRFEFHYTPKHGSWLNQIEIEFSALSRQCLGGRMPDLDTLAAAVAAWENQRNAEQARIRWMFDVAQARTKLARLYGSNSV